MVILFSYIMTFICQYYYCIVHTLYISIHYTQRDYLTLHSLVECIILSKAHCSKNAVCVLPYSSSSPYLCLSEEPEQ